MEHMISNGISVTLENWKIYSIFIVNENVIVSSSPNSSINVWDIEHFNKSKAPGKLPIYYGNHIS